jgi:hypothetical protein
LHFYSQGHFFLQMKLIPWPSVTDLATCPAYRPAYFEAESKGWNKFAGASDCKWLWLAKICPRLPFEMWEGLLFLSASEYSTKIFDQIRSVILIFGGCILLRPLLWLVLGVPSIATIFISYSPIHITTCYGLYRPSSGGIHTVVFKSYYAYNRSVLRLYSPYICIYICIRFVSFYVM